MVETDLMNVNERRKYLHKMRFRYWQARRKSERSRLQDEMKEVLFATSYPYINLTGITQFRLRFTIDDNNDNGADYMQFYSGNYVIATARPALVIEYYVP